MHDRRTFFSGLSAAALAVGVGSGCSRKVRLEGAGATFPYPLYSRWIAEYGRVSSSVRINYQSIGSGGGIRQILARTVDFGASDVPLHPEELRAAPAPLVHVPTTLGAVAVVVNLPNVTRLRLEPETLSSIYLGRIRRWRDPAIVKANPGVALPGSPISVVFRTDGSGTTAVFTEYLAKVDGTFRDAVGVAKRVKWPVGLGAKGNEGVTGQVKSMPGTIGYVELAYARQSRMTLVALRNPAGRFISPSPDSIHAAAADVPLPASLHASVVASAAPGAYPIAAYTYLLVYANNPDAKKGRELARFLWWGLHEGQAFARPLHYSPLPERAAARVAAAVQKLEAEGQRALSDS